MYDSAIKKPGCTPKVQTIGPNLYDILEDICNCFKVPIESVSGKCKSPKLVKARRIYCYVSCMLTDSPMIHIAALLNFDHSSVSLHRTTCIEWFKIKEPTFLNEWEEYLINSKIWGKFPVYTKRKLHEWSEEEWFNIIAEKIKSSSTGGYSSKSFYLDIDRPPRTIFINLRKLVKKGRLISVRYKYRVEYFLPEKLSN